MNNKSQAFRIIFITQLFQSMSHFGLKAIVLLYFVQVLHWTDAQAYQVFGAFMSLLCIIPVLGGYLTDHWLGHKNAILYGGMVICCGHICMTFGSQSHLFLGLSFLTFGTGLMLPAIASLISALYEEDTAQRDKAYNLYYLAVNVGGIGAGLLVGSTAHWLGWHAGFGLAAIGMFIALFLVSTRWSVIERCIQPNHTPGIPLWLMIILTAAITLGLWWCFYHIEMVKWVVFLVALICIIVYSRIVLLSNAQQRRNLGLLTIVLLLSLSYFILYELSGTSLVLFTERVIDRQLFSVQVPTPVLQALNPLYIILFAPMMSTFWSILKRYHVAPSTLGKLALGIIISSSGFCLLAKVSSLSHPSLFWLIGVMAILTFSELFVGPVSFGAISDWGPKKYHTSLLGVWFLTGSIAAYLSAMLAKLTSSNGGFEGTSYTQVFHWVGIDGLIIGLGVVLIVSVAKRFINQSG